MRGSSLITKRVDNEIAIAVLAAGKSRRFGGGKLDAALRGKRLGRWITQSAEKAGFSRRIIIVGKSAPHFVQRLSGWDVIENPGAVNGMGTSIAAAAEAAEGCTRLVIALADMPRMSAQHLRNIGSKSGIVFTAYPDGQSGAPAAFPERCFPRLAKLTGTMGAASIDWKENIQHLPPCDCSELDDIDTVEALERLRVTLSR